MVQFNETRKGYDKEEVDGYIATIAAEYEKLFEEYKALEAEHEEAKNDTSYNEVIAASIIKAELAGKRIIANAKVEAHRISIESNHEIKEVNRKKEVVIEELKQLVGRLNLVIKADE